MPSKKKVNLRCEKEEKQTNTCGNKTIQPEKELNPEQKKNLLSLPLKKPIFNRRPDDLAHTRLLLKEAVASLPPYLRSDGWLVVEKLDKRKFFLTKSGEFIPIRLMRRIRGSDINKLLYHLVKSFKTVDDELEDPPIGFDEFFEQLIEYETPLNLLTMLNKDQMKKNTSSDF